MSSGPKNKWFPLGLRIRVALWTATMLAVSLAVALTLARHNLQRVLELKNDSFLEQKMEELEIAAVESSPVADSLDAEIRRESDAYREEGMLIIAEWPGVVQISPPDDYGEELASLAKTASPHGPPIDVRTQIGRKYRVFRRSLGELSISVVLSLDDTERLIAQFDRRLATWAVGLLAASIAGGLVLSRLVLRPVAKSIARVKQLNPSDLSARLPLTGANDELDHLAASINKMLDRLSAYHAQVIRFTADASHELRSPLSVMRAAIEVALQEQRTVEGYCEVLRSLAEQCDQFSTLVNGLLVLARADAGQLEMRRDPVNLGLIAAETVEMYEPLADERGLQLSYIDSKRAMALGDRDRLRQLISNLIDNAIKFTNSPGKVTVTVWPDASNLRLRVSDTGCGIPAAQQAHVFERFFRVEYARTGNGFGLGLSICKWIAEAHGGAIRVAESSPKGTTIEVVLPLHALNHQVHSGTRDKFVDAPAETRSEQSPNKAGASEFAQGSSVGN